MNQSGKWIRVLGWAIRLTIAGLFIFAAVLKIWDPREFAINVRAYRFLPWWAVNPAALIVPWVELMMAGALLAGRWWSAGAAVIAGVTVAYCGVHIQALVRDIDVTCSCFGHLRLLSPGEMLALNVGVLACTVVLALIQRRLRCAVPEAISSQSRPPALAAESSPGS